MNSVVFWWLSSNASLGLFVVVDLFVSLKTPFVYIIYYIFVYILYILYISGFVFLRLFCMCKILCLCTCMCFLSFFFVAFSFIYLFFKSNFITLYMPVFIVMREKWRAGKWRWTERSWWGSQSQHAVLKHLFSVKEKERKSYSEQRIKREGMEKDLNQKVTWSFIFLKFHAGSPENQLLHGWWH